MFLIVGEIIGDLGIKGDFEDIINKEKQINNQSPKSYQNLPISQKFWELMEKEGYIYVENWDGFLYRIGMNKNDVEYIISRWAHFKYTKEVLDQFPNLKKIFLFQIWNDNVNLDYCKEKWIEVINFISEKSIYSVAEQTITSLIWWIRQVFTTGCNLKNWNYSRQPIWKNLEDITIWVMWCGRIWQKVIDLLQVFPCKIITYDIVFGFNKKEDWLVNLEKNLTEKWVKLTGDLDEFLQKSNYISVHIPGFDENLWLLNYSKLQNIDWIVNMARAGIVVEEDILKLLDKEKLEFYISDVVIWEPYINKINKKLINHPKVFITPHIWANTIQVQENIIEKFLDFFTNQ